MLNNVNSSSLLSEVYVNTVLKGMAALIPGL